MSVNVVLCAALLASVWADAISLSDYDKNEVKSVVLSESTDEKLIDAIECQITNAGNRFSIGYLHLGSIVVKSSFVAVSGTSNNFATGSFIYNGTRPITYINAVDQTVDGSGGYVYRVEGGVLQNATIVHLRSSIRGGAINFLVTVYVEGEMTGNDLVLGTLTTNSVLLYEKAIALNGVRNQIIKATINLVFENLRPISFIEVLDRSTNSNGGTASISAGGLNQTQLTVVIQSSAAGRNINAHVIIYGAARNSTNDFRYGRFKPGNIKLHAQRVFVPSIPNKKVTGMMKYFGERTITMMQGLAWNGNALDGRLSEGRGGVNRTGAFLLFKSSNGGFINFIVSIYGVNDEV